MKPTGSEMLQLLREELGGQLQLEDAIRAKRSEYSFSITVMDAVELLYRQHNLPA